MAEKGVIEVMWKQQIMEYKPINEQEKQDFQTIQTVMKTFDNVLTRENTLAHFTCSGFVVNKARTKVLMVYHHIYDSWSWTGGHVDGEVDFLQVAIREVLEETGVQATPVIEDMFALDVLTVVGHVKKGVYISPHLHLNATYLLEADERATLTIAEDENSAVDWLPLDQLHLYSSEQHMLPVYEKIINKMRLLQL